MMDYESLRSEGIAHLQRLAGGSWSDHNAHDPGITILEQLCYALTDLGYRASYPLPDLLASGGQDPYASLFTPAQILPGGAVTIDDLRRVVIDVPGVKNAWIDVVDAPAAIYDSARQEVSYLDGDEERAAAATAASPNFSEVRLKGLYRVRIEKSDLVDVDGRTILREAVRRLHRHRGLCEDFDDIRVLDQQPVRLEVVLEIDAAQRAPVLLADVHDRIAACMSPGVPRLTLEQMLARGRRVDQIFEGPLLENGFIDAEDLARAERRTTLRVSDLIREVMSVAGVTAVKVLRFLGEDGQASSDWLLAVPPGKTPRFDASNSRIRIERHGLAAEGKGLHAAARELSAARAAQAHAPAPGAPAARDLRPPPGRDRRIAAYSPVQEHLPALYGIGAGGLPDSATPERKAQAKQLKAYLLFYDQILANHFAQLGGAAHLFSFRDDTPPDSYFSQPVEDGGRLGLDELRVAPARHREKLRELTETGAAAAHRRNRFLDHLLARFGEHFREYRLLRPAADTEGGAKANERLAEHKRAFLRDYPRISRSRGTGFDYLEAPRAPVDDNISGLELALRRKLGVRDEDRQERFYVVEHILLRPLPGDGNQEGALLQKALQADPYSLQVTLVFPGSPSRYTGENMRRFVEHTVREETPAHLGARVVWKDDAGMEAFRAAHARWLERLRAHRLAQFGL